MLRAVRAPQPPGAAVLWTYRSSAGRSWLRMARVQKHGHSCVADCPQHMAWIAGSVSGTVPIWLALWRQGGQAAAARNRGRRKTISYGMPRPCPNTAYRYRSHRLTCNGCKQSHSTSRMHCSTQDTLPWTERRPAARQPRRLARPQNLTAAHASPPPPLVPWPGPCSFSCCASAPSPWSSRAGPMHGGNGGCHCA